MVDTATPKKPGFKLLMRLKSYNNPGVSESEIAAPDVSNMSNERSSHDIRRSSRSRAPREIYDAASGLYKKLA